MGNSLLQTTLAELCDHSVNVLSSSRLRGLGAGGGASKGLGVASGRVIRRLLILPYTLRCYATGHSITSVIGVDTHRLSSLCFFPSTSSENGLSSGDLHGSRTEQLSLSLSISSNQ